MTTGANSEIDARGLLCPLPVLRLRKCLLSLPEGAVVRLAATDPASWVDVPHFCREAGHELLLAEMAGDERIFLVRRGPNRAAAP
ncbi:MAG: sulfurtransferase TusA family protein [Paracoccaceae bacterium]